MFKSLNNSIYEIFFNLFQEKDKNSIIEPLICIVRLAILEFKPIGTKISIFNNKITYNEPNMLQGAVRWSNGDAREDLHNIFLPITKISTWYDIHNDDIKHILLYSIRGLEKLKNSYKKNSTISHSIQYYTEYLRKSINNQESQHKDKIKTRSNVTNNDANDNNDEYNSIFLKLKGIWNDREISIINNLLIELEERRKNNSTLNDSNTIINTLETLLTSKEDKVYDLIVKSTTLLE